MDCANTGRGGFSSRYSRRGARGTPARRAAPFALIVAAAGLPGSLDGPATLRQARARQPWLKALFTGDAGERRRWDSPDCDEFVAAPLQRRELLGCVFELLHRQSASGGAGLERRYRAQLRSS